jgi:REP element-mobilizing transposase RayT
MKFKNKFRSESHRSRGWDYGGKGKYFVTILTKHRETYFGEVKPGRKDDGDSMEQDSQVGNPYVVLSEIGNIVQDFWLEIPVHFPFVTLDEYIIMPDHIHGILFFHIDKTPNPVNTPDPGVSDPGVSQPECIPIRLYPTKAHPSLNNFIHPNCVHL